METRDESKFWNARKKVGQLRGFYVHLAWYVGISLLLIGSRIYYMVTAVPAPTNMEFQNWLDWNIFLLPVIWGIAVAIHAQRVFSLKWNPLARWEKRKLREIMESEE